MLFSYGMGDTFMLELQHDSDRYVFALLAIQIHARMSF